MILPHLAILAVLVLALGSALGRYVCAVFDGRGPARSRLAGVERLALRACGVHLDAHGRAAEMGWATYAMALLAVQTVGALVLYVLQRTQWLLPLNPHDLPGVLPPVAFDTAASFSTNTDWQAYGGETTLSHLTQMAGVTVQNFASAAVGLCGVAALTRGFARQSAATIGNAWQDLVRGVLYVLLPLSVALSLALVATGVVQSCSGGIEAVRLQPLPRAATQWLPLGPVASQVAIKQLGSNGGGFFNANSAHPFENPSPVSNLLELVAILLLPVACCLWFGGAVRDRRQGWALLAAMALLFAPAVAVCTVAEAEPGPAWSGLGVDAAAGVLQGGGNMEGKEARLGTDASALWAVATAATSNGSVNSMHDSFSPLGGLVPLALILLGEVVFGGVGSGLYGMLLFALLAVFLAGLMVGRTPEYLGKKVGPFELKMVALGLLLPSACVLLGAAVGVGTEAGRAAIHNPGPHGLSEVLYAFASAANNNGSAFAGLAADQPLYSWLLGACMLVGRYGVLLPVLALAGSFAGKRRVARSSGTLATHTPLFVVLLVAIVVLVGALTFVPALALGPVAEQGLWEAR